MKSPDEKKLKSRLLSAPLLALLALAGIAAATFAWLSISGTARVNTLKLDITLGNNLRMDTKAHDNIEDYYKTLDFAQIASAAAAEKGYDFNTSALDPVTTEDYETFKLEDGSVADASSGKYLEFVLHFMSQKDMIVHLTSANGDGAENGTLFTSSVSTLPDAMRISFTVDGHTCVYDPGSENVFSESKNTPETAPNLKIDDIIIENCIFSLPKSEEMIYNEQNRLFVLKAGEDKAVTVHLWMEGTDPACEDSLKNADYNVRLRFEGTDVYDALFD